MSGNDRKCPVRKKIGRLGLRESVENHWKSRLPRNPGAGFGRPEPGKNWSKTARNRAFLPLKTEDRPKNRGQTEQNDSPATPCTRASGTHFECAPGVVTFPWGRLTTNLTRTA